MIRVALSLICFFFSLSEAAAQERKVLLIGVMDYDETVVQLAPPLHGPGNDVALLSTLFVETGLNPSAITALTDAPGQINDERIMIDSPNRKNILKALSAIAKSAQSGDEIVIYFAGHGAQIPASGAAEEPDGLTEVFLPNDFELTAQNGIRSYITDNEIGEYIDKMLGAGATVWFIADTCHSGSLRREVNSKLTERFVDLSSSNISHQRQNSEPSFVSGNIGQTGQFVGFYAAAAGSLAYEAKPSGQRDTHGLLTWALANAIRSSGETTYSGLARTITSEIWTLSAGRASPRFEGALGASQMFADLSKPNKKFSVLVERDLEIDGGRLDGLEVGTELLVKDKHGKQLFQTRLSNVSLARSSAPIPLGPLPYLDSHLKSEGLDPQRFRLRWLSDRAPTLVVQAKRKPLSTALRVELDSEDANFEDLAGVDELFRSLSPRVVRDDAKPDAQLTYRGGKISLTPAPIQGALSYRFESSKAGIELLRSALLRKAKSHSIFQIAKTLHRSDLSRRLIITLNVEHLNRSQDFDCGLQTQKAQPGAPGINTVPTVYHCDRVIISVENRNPWPVDISPFYFASDDQIYYLTGYKDALYGGWRIPSNTKRELRYIEATHSPDGTQLATGKIHVVLLAERGKTGVSAVDFRFLEQRYPPMTTRARSEASLSSLLTEAGFGLAKSRTLDETVFQQSGAVLIPMVTVANKKESAIAE